MRSAFVRAPEPACPQECSKLRQDRRVCVWRLRRRENRFDFAVQPDNPLAQPKGRAAEVHAQADTCALDLRRQWASHTLSMLRRRVRGLEVAHGNNRRSPKVAHVIPAEWCRAPTLSEWPR